MPRPRALLLVRNTFAHDARVLRAARVLRDSAFEPKVVAVMSTGERRATQVMDGIPVLRLDPNSPLSWLRSRWRRPTARAPAPAPVPATTGAAGTRPPGYGALVRVHRWLRTLDYYRRALGVVRRERPALIHCNDYNTMWIGVLSRFVGRPAVVYDTHELWPDRNLRPEPRAWLVACEWLFVRSADAVVASSPGHADVVARRYRRPRPHVVRNIPLARGACRLERAAEPDVAVYVGAIAPNRGLEQMLEAMALVDGLRLRIMGPAREGYVAGLLRTAVALGVAERVEIVAPVPSDEVVRSIGGAAFGVALFQPTCLSHRLVAPNKVFEYLTAGLPSLVSDLPVIRAFVDEHHVGRAVDPDRPEAIAAGARSLLDATTNGELRAAVAVAARTVTWENERRILDAAYAQAIGRRGVRARPWAARWAEYRALLQDALDAGYTVVSLDAWVREPASCGERCLVLRHDVDQCPAAALRMASIEAGLGISSTWYLRWRTAHPRAVEALRGHGMAIGLHYETLTRLAREQDRETADDALIAAARATLRAEVESFAARFGPIRSICPHGDSRLPGVRNLDLIEGEDVTDYGVEYDGDQVLRGVPLRWLTDRRTAGHWKDEQDPAALFAQGLSPIVAVIHPNHWTSRGALLLDRLCSRVAPDPLARSGRAFSPVISSRTDLPPDA